MLNWFKTTRAVDQAANAAYEEVIRAGRAAYLFERGWFEDTFDGRFASIALHGALIMRRLRPLGPPGRRAAERLQRKMFSGFDYALRETGVGDSSISRKARKLGEEFYGLARAVDAALVQTSNNELEAALLRNGLGGGDVGALAEYVRSAASHLEGLDGQDVVNGRFSFALERGNLDTGVITS